MSKMEVMETNHDYMRKPPERSPQYGSEGFRAGEHVEVWGLGGGDAWRGRGGPHPFPHTSPCEPLQQITKAKGAVMGTLIYSQSGAEVRAWRL